MQHASRWVPVIFIARSDPVLDGLVPSLAHPGGNLTSFYVFEPSFGEMHGYEPTREVAMGWLATVGHVTVTQRRVERVLPDRRGAF